MLTPEDLAAINKLITDNNGTLIAGLWNTKFTAGTSGAQAAGWILGQTYGLTQRTVKASETPITNTEIARIVTAVIAALPGQPTAAEIATAVNNELHRRTTPPPTA